jgi:hypothetical protein
MKIIFITIWITSFIIEVISFYFFRKSFLILIKDPSMSILMQVWEVLTTQTESGKRFKKIIQSPYIYFIASLNLFLIGPTLVPVTIYSVVKKLLKIKTSADKAIENEEASINEAREESEEFLKHEGMLS